MWSIDLEHIWVSFFTGRKPAHAIREGVKARVGELAQGVYGGVNHCHLTELLEEREGITEGVDPPSQEGHRQAVLPRKEGLWDVALGRAQWVLPMGE